MNARENLQRAIACAQAGDHDTAMALLGGAVAEISTCAEALGHRAWLHRQNGNLDAALADYDKMLSLLPADTHAEPAAWRADCLRLRGDPAASLQAAMEVLARFPQCRTAVDVISRAQDALGAGERPPYAMSRQEPWQPINPIIQALENDTRSFPVSVFPPVSRFLYSLVRCLRPRLALETGCYIGYSSLCAAQAMEENDVGHLHSFDLFIQRPGLESPVAGACADSLQVARAHAEQAGLSHRITFHPGDSAVRIREMFGDHGEVIDFAFVDGDHTINGALADWYEVDRVLAPGGVVMLHDTMPQKCGWMGPRHLLDVIHKKAAGKYQVINLPTPEGFGIALIQKMTAGAGPEMPPSLWELLRERLFHDKPGFTQSPRRYDVPESDS